MSESNTNDSLLSSTQQSQVLTLSSQSQLLSLNNLIKKIKQTLRSNLETLVSEGILFENETIQMRILKYGVTGKIIRDSLGCMKLHIHFDNRDFYGRTPFGLIRKIMPSVPMRYAGWDSVFVVRENHDVSVESLREPFRLNRLSEYRKELRNIMEYKDEITFIQGKYWKLCFYPQEGKKSFLSRFKIFDDFEYFEVENCCSCCFK
jgi:hypothetical protein